MLSEYVSNECFKAIQVSCYANYPQEMCGIVDLAGNWHECENVASEKESSFKIGAFQLGQLAETTGIKFIVHSHTKEVVPLHICTPSKTDVEEQAKSGVQWLIVGCNGKGVTAPIALPPTHSNTYEGRSYIYGLRDCGTLLWDFFHYEFGIELQVPVILSLVKRKEWANSVAKVGELNGFVMLDLAKTKLQKGDILLVSLFGERKSHGILYLGNEMVLNQGEVSTVAPLEKYLNYMEGIYRYGGFCQ